MKNKREFHLLIVNEGVKQFMEQFSGPFLVTYFIRLSEDGMIPLTTYSIITDVIVGLCAIWIASIIRNRFKLGMFRLGILLNLVYIALFIGLKERVLKYVWLVGIMYGFSAACYWYPLSLLKAVKIGDRDRERFFAVDRIVTTSVAVLGPIMLGTLITKLSYIQTAYLIAAISAVQLVMSFFFEPVPTANRAGLQMREALRLFQQDKAARNTLLTHLFFGLNINGGALRIIATVALIRVFVTDQSVGYATAAANLLVILGVLCYRGKFRNEKRKHYVYFCGVGVLLAWALAFFVKGTVTTVIFYCIFFSFPCMMLPIQDVSLYTCGARSTCREEFFALSEAFLNVGRCASYLLLLLAALSHSQIVMDLVTWILVLSVLYCSRRLEHCNQP